MSFSHFSIKNLLMNLITDWSHEEENLTVWNLGSRSFMIGQYLDTKLTDFDSKTRFGKYIRFYYEVYNKKT
jgi:hypothetical protein